MNKKGKKVIIQKDNSNQKDPKKIQTTKKSQKEESIKQNKKSSTKKTPPIKDTTPVVKVIDTKAIVDQYVENRGNYHIYEDNNSLYNGKFFAATLNKSSIDKNSNKFYILQLLQNDSNPNSLLFFARWGRVGVPGNNLSQNVDFVSGPKTFMKKYREKTKEGYQEIFIDYEAEKKVENKNEINKSNNKKSNKKKFKCDLDQDVLDLISLIYNKKIISDNLHELGYDSKKMPLGKLSPVTLTTGLNILKEIETELKKKKPDEENLKKLSSNFYSHIPHDFGFQKMYNFIINSNEIVKQKIDMISSLSDMKITLKILEDVNSKNDDEYENQEEKQLYDYYKQLNCDIKSINKNEPIYEKLNKYLTSSINNNNNNNYYYQQKLQLLKAYSLNRHGEEKKFKDFGNKKLLWHGTRITNYVGILSQGLRIAPPEAPSSGYLYGKGIYFADMAQKSSNYCCPVNKEALILLGEVSLGKEDQRTNCDFNLPKTLGKGKNSCHALSSYVPDGGEYINDDVYIPYGPAKLDSKNSSCNRYSEYIVYNVDQVKLKYLLKIRYI